MSLSHEQRYLLEELREYLQRVEKMVPRYDLDLDAIATEYAGTGYKTPTPNEPERAVNRRKVYTRSFQPTSFTLTQEEE